MGNYDVGQFLQPEPVKESELIPMEIRWHPTDFEKLRIAASRSGMDPESFAKLVVHRESKAVLEGNVALSGFS